MGALPRVGMPRRETLWALAMLLVSAAGAIVLLRFEDQVRALGQFGYLGAFGLAFLGNALVAVPFPLIFPVAAIGTIHSPLWITVVAALGAASGEVVPYLLGLNLTRRAGGLGRIARLESLSGVKKTLVLAGLALSPVLSYPGLVARVLRYPAWAIFGMTAMAEGLKVYLFIKGVSVASKLLFL